MEDISGDVRETLAGAIARSNSLMRSSEELISDHRRRLTSSSHATAPHITTRVIDLQPHFPHFTRWEKEK